MQSSRGTSSHVSTGKSLGFSKNVSLFGYPEARWCMRLERQERSDHLEPSRPQYIVLYLNCWESQPSNIKEGLKSHLNKNLYHFLSSSYLRILIYLHFYLYVPLLYYIPPCFIKDLTYQRRTKRKNKRNMNLERKNKMILFG